MRKEKHLEENLGKEVEIKLFRAIDNEKQLSGVLTKFDKEKIYIEINSEEKQIDRKQVAQMKLKYNW